MTRSYKTLFDFKGPPITLLLKKDKVFYLSRLIFDGHFESDGQKFPLYFRRKSRFPIFEQNFKQLSFPEFSTGSEYPYNLCTPPGTKIDSQTPVMIGLNCTTQVRTCQIVAQCHRAHPTASLLDYKN